MDLDTTVFGFPGGKFLALATFNRDGTLAISDAGDLGTSPFTTLDTPQRGVWIQTGQQTYQFTTLFLQKDETTGDIAGWHRGRAIVQFAGDSDHLAGSIEDDYLACDAPGPTPLKLLNCPDPLTTPFTPAPLQIPLKLMRMRVR